MRTRSDTHLANNAHCVCIIYNSNTIVFFSKTNNVSKLRDIAFHAKNPIYYYEFHHCRVKARHHFFEVVHIVVAEFQHFSER